MRSIPSLACAVVLSTLLHLPSADPRAADAKPQPVSYRKQIAPIFAASCVACHGGANPQSGLSLASYTALLKGGNHGKAVIPGNPSESPLVQYIEGRKQPRMPVGGALKPAEVALVRRWIAEGAKTDGEAARTVAAPAAPRIPLRVPVLPQAASLAWSKDGARLAVGTFQEVKLFDAASGKPVRTLGGHADVVRSLAFSPSGAILAAAGGVPGQGGEVKLWNAETGALLKTLVGHSDCIYGIAWRPDGAQLATVSYDKTVRLWDAAKGESIAELKDHAEAVYAVAYSANGKYVATGSADRSIRIWDAATGKRLYSLTGHTDAVTSLAFHPKADQLASGSADKTVRLWNLKADSGDAARTINAGADAITDVQFSNDGALLATASGDGAVKLWSAKGDFLRTIPAISDVALALAFKPDGQALAVGGYDGSVKLFKTADGALVATLIAPPKRAATGK